MDISSDNLSADFDGDLEYLEQNQTET
ncbi:uncharacterized protein METZ01_LOCUS388811, partial [marine metagenome]